MKRVVDKDANLVVRAVRPFVDALVNQALCRLQFRAEDDVFGNRDLDHFRAGIVLKRHVAFVAAAFQSVLFVD